MYKSNFGNIILSVGHPSSYNKKELTIDPPSVYVIISCNPSCVASNISE